MSGTRLLLDTHALLWWLDGDERLSVPAREAIANQQTVVLVSAASAWEIASKVRIGKLAGAIHVVEHLSEILDSQDFFHLPVSLDHARRAGLMPGAHRDPFDRSHTGPWRSHRGEPGAPVQRHPPSARMSRIES